LLFIKNTSFQIPSNSLLGRALTRWLAMTIIHSVIRLSHSNCNLHFCTGIVLATSREQSPSKSKSQAADRQQTTDRK